jgi:hypothetical protein
MRFDSIAAVLAFPVETASEVLERAPVAVSRPAILANRSYEQPGVRVLGVDADRASSPRCWRLSGRCTVI